MRSAFFGFVVGVSAALSGAVARAETQSSQRVDDRAIQGATIEFLNTMEIVEDARQRGDITAARQALQTLGDSADFDRLPDEAKYFFWQIFATFDRAAADIPAMLTHTKRATGFPGAVAQDWQMRFGAGYALNDADQFVSLMSLAKTWPAALSGVPAEIVLDTLRRARRVSANEDQYFAVLQSLFAANWRPDPLIARPDGFWLDLTRLLLARGQTDAALKTAAAITGAKTLIRMQIDKRFDPVVSGNPAAFDPARAAKQQVIEAQTLVDSNPTRLKAVLALAEAYLTIDRIDDMLTLTESALAKALPADGSKSAYIDAEDEVIWIMDYRQRALVRARRFDEAVALQQRAARRPERGGLNVSQAINLGNLLYGLERPKEALASISEIADRNVSDYGALALREVAVCAAAQLGDTAAVQRGLSQMKERASEGFGPYSTALLCANDFDSAAKLHIDSLADESKRADALALLQRYSWETPVTAFEIELQTRKNKVLERPDVKDAIYSVGRLMTWNFGQPSSKP